MSFEKSLSVYDKLVGGPILHASPTEHQCTPDLYTRMRIVGYQNNDCSQPEYAPDWHNGKLHGNLTGWIQARKQLPGERIAPLPEGYTYFNSTPRL